MPIRKSRGWGTRSGRRDLFLSHASRLTRKNEKKEGEENGRNPLEVPVLGAHKEQVTSLESLLWLFLAAATDATANTSLSKKLQDCKKV